MRGVAGLCALDEALGGLNTRTGEIFGQTPEGVMFQKSSYFRSSVQMFLPKFP